MAEINQFINQVELPNEDTRGVQTYHSLTIGDKVFNGSNPVTITAANLGLSQALKFVGSTNDIMKDGQKNTPTGISEPSIGDVVLSNGNGEFVWLGENWEALGSENSYALKTVQIVTNNNSGLKGGSSLAGNVSLSTNFGSASNLGTTTSAGSSNQVARADHVHGLTGITSDVSFTNSSATFTSNARIVIGNNSYGPSLPSGAVKGQIYFKLV